jgi:hypothetical protein
MICISENGTNKRLNDPGDLSALSFQFGGGLDFALAQKLYLRFEALFGIKLANKMEKDLKDRYEAQYKAQGATVETKYGQGPIVKLAAGYKF